MPKKNVIQQTAVALVKGNRRAWKLRQTADELMKWSTYLQQSAENFLNDLETFGGKDVFVTTSEAKVYQEVLGCLQTLKKESTLLINRSRRLPGN